MDYNLYVQQRTIKAISRMFPDSLRKRPQYLSGDQTES